MKVTPTATITLVFNNLLEIEAMYRMAKRTYETGVTKGMERIVAREVMEALEPYTDKSRREL